MDKEKKNDFSLGGLLNDEMQRKLIYDMVIVYDIWFDREETKDENADPEGQDESAEKGDA